MSLDTTTESTTTDGTTTDTPPAPDGLAQLRAGLDGGFRVPVAELLDMSMVEVERGRIVFRCPADVRFANPMGGLHGGISATLLDSAMGCAVHTTLAAGEVYTTLTIEVKYLRSAPLDGTDLVAEGHVVHRGRRQATAEATLVDGRGKVVATATSTCMIIS